MPEGNTDNEVTKKKNWFVRHKVSSVLMVIATLFVIVGIANSSDGTTTISTATTSTTAQPTVPAAPAKPQSKVGSTLKLGDGADELSVTAAQVMDPAQPDSSYAVPDGGKRFVAVKLDIANVGSSTINDDANNDLTIIGSDNQSYTPIFYGVSGCTNFSNGEYTLVAGATAIGCVMYELPTGVAPAKVQFSMNSGMSDAVGEWSVQ